MSSSCCCSTSLRLKTEVIFGIRSSMPQHTPAQLIHFTDVYRHCWDCCPIGSSPGCSWSFRGLILHENSSRCWPASYSTCLQPKGNLPVADTPAVSGHRRIYLQGILLQVKGRTPIGLSPPCWQTLPPAPCEGSVLWATSPTTSIENSHRVPPLHLQTMGCSNEYTPSIRAWVASTEETSMGIPHFLQTHTLGIPCRLLQHRLSSLCPNSGACIRKQETLICSHVPMLG